MYLSIHFIVTCVECGWVSETIILLLPPPPPLLYIYTGPVVVGAQPLVSRCDAMQRLAQSASDALGGNTTLCTSSPPPECNTVSCSVLANQDRLQFQVSASDTHTHTHTRAIPGQH